MLDIIGKLPDELLEVYDVINIRYFSCVVQNNNPSPVLENVLRMLSTFLLHFFFSMLYVYKAGAFSFSASSLLLRLTS